MVSRVTVEHLSSIDVNQLNRLGAFSGVTMEFPFMSLRTWRYLMLYHPPNWPKERLPQRISISWTRCHFGYGWRPWFLCACGRRWWVACRAQASTFFALKSRQPNNVRTGMFVPVMAPSQLRWGFSLRLTNAAICAAGCGRPLA
jgi:hypothetical protein